MGAGSDIKAGRAFVELFADDSKLVRGLKAAQQKLKSFGAATANIGKYMMGAGAAALAPLVAATADFMKAGSDLTDMAGRTGMSTETLSELGYAADQTGANLEAIETSAKKMQKGIVDAANGGKEAREAFSGLGLSVEELAAMTPDQQFESVAAALGRIADPTQRAATAMEVFGKSGTDLLPMIADMDALRARAKELGVTFSGADAAAADGLGDALGDMWTMVKTTSRSIVALLAPALTQIAQATLRVVETISGWIRDNREIIATVAKIAAVVAVGVAAAGAVLVTFGAAAQIAAIALGGLATGLSLIGAAIGFLTSPIGLVVAGVAALTTWWATCTQSGAAALEWLAGWWRYLKDTAVRAWEGISNAIAAGDLSQAWSILTKTLRVYWLDGMIYLRTKWEETKEWFFSNFPGISTAFNEVIAFIRTAWSEGLAWLQKKWVDFSNSIFTEMVAGGMADWFATSEVKEAKRVTAWRKAGVSEQEIAKRQGGEWGKNQEYYDKILAGGKGRWSISGDDIRKTLKEQMKENREKADADKAAIDADKEAKNQEIQAAKKRWQDAIDAGTDVEGRDSLTMQAEVEAARKEWEDALAKAKKAKKEREYIKAPGAKPGEIKKLATKPSEVLEKSFVAGTFNASMLGRMGTGGTYLERIARAVEDSARMEKRHETEGMKVYMVANE